MAVYAPLLCWWTATGFGWGPCRWDPYFTSAFTRLEDHILKIEWIVYYLNHTHPSIPHDCVASCFPPIPYLEPRLQHALD